MYPQYLQKNRELIKPESVLIRLGGVILMREKG